MKKIILLSIAAAFVVVSCNKENAGGSTEPEYVTPASITAVFENDNPTADATKMDIIDLKPTWNEGDRIMVGGAEYECKNAQDGLFEHVSGTIGTSNICCYPASLYKGVNQYNLPYSYTLVTSEVAGTPKVKTDYLPMFGQYKSNGESGEVVFRNIGSAAQFRLKNTANETMYAKSLIITPYFANSSMTTNGNFSVGFSEDGIPSLNWTDDSSHTPFALYKFAETRTLAPGAMTDVIAFLPAGNYSDLNIRTEGYKTDACDGQVYFSSVNLGTAETLRNNWYKIGVKSGEWNVGVKGNGTADSPFELGSAADIAYINGQVKSQDATAKDYFKQAFYTIARDITVDSWDEAIGGSVVGTTTEGAFGVFSGVFDGQGHTITVKEGVKATRPIFWDTDGAVIKNLIVECDFHDGAARKTSSAFFYSALNTCMVACVYNGNAEAAVGGSATVFGAMNNTCYLQGCSWNSNTQYLVQAVDVNGDTSIIDTNNRSAFSASEDNVTKLNGALDIWNAKTNIREEARTDYRYVWYNGKLILTQGATTEDYNKTEQENW